MSHQQHLYMYMQPPPILPLYLLTQLMCISGTSFLSQKNNEKIPSEGFDEAHISQTNPEHTIIFMIRSFFFSPVSEFDTKTFLSGTLDPTGLFSRTYYLFFSRIIIISSFVCFFLPIFSAFGRVWLSIISNLSFRGCLWGILSLKTLI